MDDQPGQEDGEGAGQDRDPAPPPPPPGPGSGPDSGPGPGGPGAAGPDPAAARPGRDPRLAGFAWGDAREAPAPSGRLALLIDELSGPERRCPGADDGEVTGLVRAAAAAESWAA